MRKGKASAPGKIILFGEHFVVHGNPAILASINRRIAVSASVTKLDRIAFKSDIGIAGAYTSSGFAATNGGTEAKEKLDPLLKAITKVLGAMKKKTGLEIDISSNIPPGVGLGSSAAACVATVAAVSSLYQRRSSRKKICEFAIGAERLIHKNSSGADCYVSTFGGLIQFSKTRGFKKLRSRNNLPLVIASTGVSHSTGELVASVMNFKDKNESLFRNLSRQAAEICSEATSAIASGDHDKLGGLMNENQAILRQIGISHYKVDDLIDICLKSGALGAKITGAGGGGAIIAIAASQHDGARISSRAKAAGYESFEVEIDRKGVI